MIKERKPHKELKSRPKRAVATYLALLLVCAIFLLLLAYFTQDRAFAQAAAPVLPGLASCFT